MNSFRTWMLLLAFCCLSVVTNAQTILYFETEELEIKWNEPFIMPQLIANTDGKLKYSVSDLNVARIDENTGKLDVLEPGEIKVSVTSEKTENYPSATASFLLRVLPLTLELDKSFLVLKMDESKQLYSIIDPGNSLSIPFKWSSSNESVALVSDNGTITPVSAGTALITSEFGSMSASCVVIITSGYRDPIIKNFLPSQCDLSTDMKDSKIQVDENIYIIFNYAVQNSNAFLIRPGNAIKICTERDDIRLKFIFFRSSLDYRYYFTDRVGTEEGSLFKYGYTAEWIGDSREVTLGNSIFSEYPLYITQMEITYEINGIPISSDIINHTYNGNTITYIIQNECVAVFSATGLYSVNQYVKGEVDIPEFARGYKVTSIGPHAFFKASQMESINIPKTVSTIGACAFQNCVNLKTVSIPSSVESIDEMAFYNDHSLKEIYCYASPAPIANPNTFSDYSATLYVPAGAMQSYMESECWSRFADIKAMNVPTYIKITGLDSQPVTIGKQIQLTPILYPSNLDNQEEILSEIEWESSQPTVATISSDGLLTVLDDGFTIITATYKTISGINTVVARRNITNPTYIENFSRLNTGFPENADDSGYVQEITSNYTNINYSVKGAYIQNDYLLLDGDKSNNAYITFSFDKMCEQIQLLTSANCPVDNNSAINLYANDHLIGKYMVNAAGCLFTIDDIPIAYQKPGTVYKIESALSTFKPNFVQLSFIGDVVKPSKLTVKTISLEGDENKTFLKLTESVECYVTVEPVGCSYGKILWATDDEDCIQIDVSEASDGTRATITVKNDAELYRNARIYCYVENNPNITCDFRVQTNPLLLGDANDNLLVNIGDLVTIGNFILKESDKNDNFCFVNCDVDKNKEIDIADLSGTVNIIFGKDNDTKITKINGLKQVNDIRFPTLYYSLSDDAIDFKLNETFGLTSLQAEFKIPESMIVSDILLGNIESSHNMRWSISEDNIVRVIIYSFRNETLNQCGPSLFTIKKIANAGDKAQIIKVIGADAMANRYEIPAVENIEHVTEVRDILSPAPLVLGGSEEITIHNASGKKIEIYKIDGLLYQSFNAVSDKEVIGTPKGLYVIRIEKEQYKIIVK